MMSTWSGTDKGGKSKKERRKRPDELLSSVVQETVVSAAVNLLRDNPPFAFPGGTAWAILALSTAQIGGLNARQNRDEAKGSIIQLIKDDQIQTFATAEMLDGEVFCVIPTATTLDRMSEFGLFSSAIYKWAVVRTTDLGTTAEPVLDSAVSFSQAVAVANGTLSLADAVGPQVWAQFRAEPETQPRRASGFSDDEGSEAESDPADSSTNCVDNPAAATESAAGSPSDAGDALFDELPTAPDEVYFDQSPDLGDELTDEDLDEEPDLDDPPDFEASAMEPESREDAVASSPIPDELMPEQASGPIMTEPDLELDQDDPANEDDPADEEGSAFGDGTAEGAAVPAQTPEPDELVAVADQTTVRANLARRFLTEDLDLEITLEEFEATFSTGRPTVRIEVPDGASNWLGDQIAQLVRQANARLAQRHADSEAQLRAKYVELMALHVEGVIKVVSPDRPGTVYTNLNEVAQSDLRQKLAAKDDTIRQAQQKLRDAFAVSVSEVGQQAAQQAELQYRQRHAARLQREEIDAALAVEATIETEHAHAQSMILDLRRKDAAMRMAFGRSRVFQVLQEEQKKNLADEQALLVELTAQIQRTIDENRKNDISRSEALATELATFDRVAALQREHTEALDRQRIEHEARQSQAAADFERARKEITADMAMRGQEWKNAFELKDAEARHHADERGKLIVQMNEMGDSFQRQYKARVNDLEADRATYLKDMERTNQVQARMLRILLTLGISVGLLMLAVGIIVGALVL